MSIINSSLSMVIKSDSVLTEKTVVDNGEYDANQEGYDGYSKVNVGVTEFSKIDGVNYNIYGTDSVLENGRFWTKWDNHKGIRPVDTTGDFIKIDWANDDWELGAAVLSDGEIVKTQQNTIFGLAVPSTHWCDAPTLYVNHTVFPTEQFLLRKTDNTQRDDGVMNCDLGLVDGFLPNTWYFVKASYNSTTKMFTVSATKDFTTWETTTATYDRVPSTTTNDYIGFASANMSYIGNPAQNLFLDLANTYIKQNGTIVWGNFDGKFSDKYTSQEAI